MMTDTIDKRVFEDQPGWNPKTMGNRRGTKGPRRPGPRAPERGPAAAKRAASLVRRRGKPSAPGVRRSTTAMQRMRQRQGAAMRQRKSRRFRSAFRRSGFGKQLDPQLQEIIEKYNPYHGKDGKFTSASRGGGAKRGAKKAGKRASDTAVARGYAGVGVRRNPKAQMFPKRSAKKASKKAGKKAGKRVGDSTIRRNVQNFQAQYGRTRRLSTSERAGAAGGRKTMARASDAARAKRAKAAAKKAVDINYRNLREAGIPARQARVRAKQMVATRGRVGGLSIGEIRGTGKKGAAKKAGKKRAESANQRRLRMVREGTLDAGAVTRSGRRNRNFVMYD